MPNVEIKEKNYSFMYIKESLKLIDSSGVGDFLTMAPAAYA